MEIFQVEGSLVCTCRHPGLEQLPLRVLRDVNGKRQIAVDTIGSCEGSWVFTVNGTAARMALDDPTLLSDLTIGGVIDSWEQQDAVTNSAENH